MNDAPPQETPVAALQYASRGVEKPSLPVYRAAIVLAVVPAVLWGLTLLMFWVMRWAWPADLTTVMVAGSTWMVIAGVAALIVFIARERRYRRLSEGKLWVRVLLAVLLLCGNVPVVRLYVSAPTKLKRGVTVTVVNSGTSIIDKFLVVSAKGKTDIGPIAPGATATGRFHITLGEGLGYEAWQITANSRSMAGGSLGNRQGQHTVTIKGTSLTVTSK